MRNSLLYLARRLALLLFTLGTAVYVTILIANYGGYVDTIVASRIEEQVGFMMLGGAFDELAPEARNPAAEQLIAEMQAAAGLNEPFLLRSFRYLLNGLTLNWGEAEFSAAYGLNSRGKSVQEIVVENLSRSVLVFGTANFFLFFFSIGVGLFLNRRQGQTIDRVFTILTPISSAPAWVFGILLTVLLLRLFGFSPGGTFDLPPGELAIASLLVLLRHLLLPFLAIVVSGFFLSVYSWRSLFQLYSSENYVEMAQARGLSAGRIDRRYILRPALPALLTSFGLTLVVLWQEIIALEFFFNVQGIGSLFIAALNNFDTPMIVAIVTVFAYLIAFTVFLLDIAYVLVDPRIWAGRMMDGSERGARRGLWVWWRKRPFFPKRTMLVWPTFSGVMTSLKRSWRETAVITQSLVRYPSALVGLLIIFALIGVSIYTVITIPYQEVGSLWRGDGNVWVRNPQSALPSWVNAFRRQDLPPSFSFSSADFDEMQVTELSDGLTELVFPFTFAYDYGDFPQDMIVDVTATYQERGPHVIVSWRGPDGNERELTSFRPVGRESYFVARDERLMRRLDSERPEQRLFLGQDGMATAPVAGDYTLIITALLFEPETTVEVEANILGQVYGWAGTDTERRDLMIPLLWGTPVALGFGLIAALVTSVGSLLLAAIGVWFGGSVDRLIQFFTEVNLILPFFPVSLMIFTLYSRSIFVILGVTVALMIFGSSIKLYRAALLQERTAVYLEAAQAYGASDWRIVFKYLFPRMRGMLLPKLIILVPSFVFLEATLSFLGISDPLLPTWGKLLVAAMSTGVYTGDVQLVAPPLLMLFLTGFAFAMVGFALEQIFEPRLQQS